MVVDLIDQAMRDISNKHGIRTEEDYTPVCNDQCCVGGAGWVFSIIYITRVAEPRQACSNRGISSDRIVRWQPSGN